VKNECENYEIPLLFKDCINRKQTIAGNKEVAITYYELQKILYKTQIVKFEDSDGFPGK
jgi:hypothetical protein